MRRHKESLIEKPVTVSIRADFIADRRRRKAAADHFDIFSFSYDISSRRSQSPAGIFYERTHCNIRADFARFFLFHEFPVTIIDENTARKAQKTHIRTNFPDFLYRKGIAKFIAAGTLNINHFQAPPQPFYILRDFLFVKLSRFRQIRLFERNSEIFQRSVSFSENYAANGIVRHSRDREHTVARPQNAE